MSSYSFIKAGIVKTFAFEAYLEQNFPQYQDFSYTDPDLVINTTVVLDGPQLADLQTLVDDYTDPDVFLLLDTTTTDACCSMYTSSPIPENVLSFIFSPVNPVGSSTFNALKTVMEYSTEDISAFANGNTSCTVIFEIFDYTRDIQISSNTLDITDILEAWQTLAQTQSGPQYKLRSFMIEGLRNVIANYDCIWQFKISVSNPNVRVRTNSMQRLYYEIL